ncbi:MAG: uroporphyrinogen-III synthase [Dokdonella sp.]
MNARSPARRAPLEGTTLVVTRPSLTASAQVRAARALGAVVLRLPGLALHAIEDADGARAALRGAATADAWIFTSPAGVRFAFALQPDLRPHAHARVFAVGSGTARALALHAIDAQAPAAQQDSEGLLALDALAAPAGQKIVIVDAPGGRNLIANGLRARGAEVERIPVYRRGPPPVNARHLRALEAATLPWITLVSSGEALGHLVATVTGKMAERWRAQPMIVSSNRLAEQARAAGFNDIHCARSALTRDLLECACTLRERRR